MQTNLLNENDIFHRSNITALTGEVDLQKILPKLYHQPLPPLITNFKNSRP